MHFRLHLALVASLIIGCTGKNPDARLDFATRPNDMATSPHDLVPPPPPEDLAPTGVQLTAGGLLESVSSDQARVAFLPAPATVARVSTGELDVQAVPYGQPRRIAANAWGASFSGASTLYYSTAPTASSDSASTAVYGGLGVWRPGWSAGLSLSSRYVLLRAGAGDGSFVVWWDAATPSNAGAGDLLLARASDCDGSRCTPVTVAAGVQHLTALIATTGFAAYTVKNGTTYDVWLVDVAVGTATQLSSGGTSGAISISSDGTLLAGIGAGGSLQVWGLPGGGSVAWAALPAGARAQSLGFADATTLAVRALPAGASKPAAYATTATAARLVASDISAINVARSGAGGTTRWLFCAGSVDANGIGDVGAYDLSAATPARIAIADSTALAQVAPSYDQTLARVLEHYDATQGTGTLELVSLPDGAVTHVDDAVAGSGVSFGGSHTLLWLAAGGALDGLRDGVTTSYAGGVSDFRVRGGPGTVYFTVGGSDAVFRPGIWFASLR